MKNILQAITKEEMSSIQIIVLKQGQILFMEGEECLNVGIVIEGEIEIVSYTFNGKEIIFNQLGPGMMFANNLIFSSDPHYKGSIIAKKPAKVALINKKQLILMLKNNEEFLLSYLHYQSDSGKELNSKIKLLSISSAEERFFFYAHNLGNIVRYKSVTSLADSLYLQRETLSRLISRLIKEKKIIKNAHTIKIIINN